MLDIIVTHYDEPWETGRKFFDMLGCQRGISPSNFRVILVHDGGCKFPKEYFRRYPYRVIQYRIPHAGVSAARNYGLDMATDKWVQFCDFDDMYSNAYALMGILPHMEKDLDFLWTPYMSEYAKGMDILTRAEEKENIVFIHGKYFRREWLNENGLRFPEWIQFSEDSAFCAMVNELAEPGRRGKIRTAFPAYVWCVRPDSISMRADREERNLAGLIDRNFYVVEEFIRRGIPHTLMVGRMFADAYWAFHRKGKAFPDEEARFATEARKYIPELDEVVRGDQMNELMQAAMTNLPGTIDERAETFTAWIQRINDNGKG